VNSNFDQQKKENVKGAFIVNRSSRLKTLKADGSYTREMAKIEKCDLVILDDFGLMQLDSTSRMIFLEIIEDRH
jgi:DNA replication protein DnaC